MKRKTKAQKEAELKAALLRRVLDICIACEAASEPDELLVGPVEICRVMRAVRHLWAGDLNDKDNSMRNIVAHWNFDEYESPQRLTEFLYRMGVRA